jgi:Uma2 family endonuclease
MTAASLPEQLLTSAEFVELPDTELRYELQGGNVVMSPPPIPEHQTGLDRLSKQLEPFLPPGLRIAPGIGVDLQLAPPDEPGFVRVPDLAVVTEDGLRRRRREGGVLRASEVVLAVEWISPSSVRTDRTIKRDEYADAGIPHYWIIEMGERTTLTACHLAGEFGYADSGPLHSEFTTSDPFELRIDLDALLPW